MARQRDASRPPLDSSYPALRHRLASLGDEDRAELFDSARAMVAAGAAADDDDVAVRCHCPMCASTAGRSRTDGGVDLIHEPLILDRALETHFRRAAVADRADEIAIHRAVATDVPEAREHQPGKSTAADQDDRAVRLE